MSLPDPGLLQSMHRASAMLQAGDFVRGRALLEDVLRTAPRFVEAHRLLAGALQALGDDAGAERVLREAVMIAPAWAPAQLALGELLLRLDRPAEAEPALRAALSADRRNLRAALALAQMLNSAARPREALEVCASFARAAQPDLELLTQQAAAFTALAMHDQAIALSRRILEAAPGHPIAQFNLAAALEAGGHDREAESAASNAIGSGADMPEARLVHARALMGLGRFDEAEAALKRAIAQRPTSGDAHLNLAQLIWMRSGDLAAAGETLDVALRAHADVDALHIVKAKLLDGAGEAAAALDWLEERLRASSASVDVLLAASIFALPRDPEAARAHAERALVASPRLVSARLALADALLATGDPAGAEAIVTDLMAERPLDQRLIASLTTAWRLQGDPRYHDCCDYPTMARGWTLDAPHGWSNLPSYLRDLAASLHALHGLHAHPLHQSLRGGSQTTQKNLLDTDDPAIRAFPEAIDGPIRRHLRALGAGTDPLRRHNAGDYGIQGIWSVRLRGEGYHVNHVHPQGWLSSACYIELPQGLSTGEPVVNGANANAGDRAGWLKLGEPGVPTRPPLAPEFFIRPEPGLLALFPSYFWHGTVPFAGDDTRLTIAFDLVPVARR
ncbi:MAG TPA: tetratricopeptide repeat protein [Xanthomonadaceae bacterium]|jgi:tetratricopeptide (TPR) repeat protein